MSNLADSSPSIAILGARRRVAVAADCFIRGLLSWFMLLMLMLDWWCSGV